MTENFNVNERWQVVREPDLILLLQLEIILGISLRVPAACQGSAEQAGKILWPWKRREPCSDLWDQGNNIPEEQNWGERTGMDTEPKEQAEQDSSVLARALIWHQMK